jgi:hypothetical protein
MILRTLAWAVALPVAILLLTAIVGPAGLAACLIYPAQVLRDALRDRQGVRGGLADRLTAAWIALIGKFGEAHGALEYVVKRFARAPIRNVFYK